MSDKPDHKSTSYSGKKPYITHNYRTMMKKKTAEEYYFHELNRDPMSEMLKPYWRDPEIPGFGWEYMAPPDGGWMEWPPFQYPGGGSGADLPDDDDGLDDDGCEECQIVGPESIECGDAWLGQIIPSECAGFITFALGLDDQEELEVAVNDSGALAVAVPDDTLNESFLVCSSGGIHGATCCIEITVDCELCCEQFTFAGASTVNPGATWEGTVDPPCPGATVEVVSNSGCTINGTIDEAGETVSVPVGAQDCGSFTATVSPPEGCDEISPVAVGVKINNVDQDNEADYTQQNYTCTPTSQCNFCRNTGPQLQSCFQDIYFYTGQKWCCVTDAPGLPGQCFTDSGCETGPGDCPAQECFMPCFDGTHYCTARACPCQNRAYVWFHEYEWVCSC